MERLHCISLKAEAPIPNPPMPPDVASPGGLIRFEDPMTGCRNRFVDLLPGKEKELSLRQEYQIFLDPGRFPPSDVLGPGRYTLTTFVRWSQWHNPIVRPGLSRSQGLLLRHSLQEVFAFEIPRYANVEACVAGKRPKKIAYRWDPNGEVKAD
jgi:hypothetical protein